MSNVLKKVSAVFLLILMITSVSFNTISYGVDIFAKLRNEALNKITKLNANNISTTKYDLMITNRNNNNQAYNANAVAKNINSGDSSDNHVLLTQDSSGQYYYCMEKGGFLMLYTNGGATLREFYYNRTSFKENVTIEQKMVLAYLNAEQVTQVEGVQLNVNNNREKLIQYYIWKSNINQGSSVSVPSEYAQAISTLQRSVNRKITVGKDIIDINEGTITIKEKQYKVESFDAYRYTAQLVYRRDNGKGYAERNYKGAGQEIFTFNSTLKLIDKNQPKIKVYKVNEKDEAISGAVITIYDRKTGKEIGSYETRKDGFTSEIPVEYGNQYIIKETKAPTGYKLSNEFVVVDIIEKDSDFKVYDENNKFVQDSLYWSETELSDELEIILTLEDEKDDKQDTPQLQIYKHDENGNPIPGVEFTIVEYPQELELSSDKLIVQENGYTNIMNIDGLENGKTYKLVLRETYAPEGYKKLDSDINVTIEVNDEGKILINSDWTINNESDTSISDENIMVLDIENKKEGTPKTPKIELQLLKIDADTKNPLDGAMFEVTGAVTGTLTSGEIGTTGYTNTLNIENLEPNNTYEIKIRETMAPSNEYKDPATLEEIVIQISINSDGTINEPNIINNNQGIQISYDKTTGKISLTVTNTKKEENKNKDQAYPLLMYIKGTAFLDGVEGKESLLDGYYNSDNNSDKGIEGIKVEIYDEATNELAILATRETLTLQNSAINFDTSSVDWTLLEKYGKATAYTDENGFFEFYGLNPSHKYYLIFTYNGMRYAEVKATTETGIDISGYDISKENASKATEIDRQTKIVDVFSEIGTYPYNYYSTSKNGYNIAYNQDDVEEAIKNGLNTCGNSYETLYSNLSQYMEQSLAYFIQDCQVTAKISGLGNILEEAEIKVKEYNKTIKENAGEYLYPVVKHHNTPNIDQVEFYKKYGYTIQKFYSDKITNPDGSYSWSEPYWHFAGAGSVGELSYDERKDGDWKNVKDRFIQQDKELMQKLNELVASSNNETRYIADIAGDWSELLEGYKSETIIDVQWAIFDGENKQYLGDWYDKCQSVTYKDEYNKLIENLNILNEDINRNLPCANLGVQYRNTFDIALYNDALKADVTINNVLGTYEYDKRAANGAAFSFGVSEYDLRSYYKNLTEGNVENLRALKYNTTISSTDEYLNYLRTSDIHYLSEMQKTDNGIGIAGGYDDNDNSIYITYKIRLINQSSIKGTVTEISDYYDSNFEVTRVYDENNKEYEFSSESIYNSRGSKSQAPSGYSTVYIKVNNMELANNESQYLYLVLKMKDIPNTLTEEALNNGYKTLNLAEINGYKTANGYIDIDSMPGNVVETNRFENGKYEDDESKSPTLIFKNPNKEGRTISGIVFEDATTGEWSINQTRQSTANNQYDEKEDTLIQGATVQLIQILNDGTEKMSSQTATTENGEYKFMHIRPGNYVIRFAYGNTDKTALTNKNKIDDQGNEINIINAKSYNGESYESTERKFNTTLGAEGYWYTDSDIETNIRYSDATDNADRRKEVANNFATLRNDKSEILNSFKDTKVNRNLVNELKIQSCMYATTDNMKLEMEYVGSKNPNTNGIITTANTDGKYIYEYNITNVDFGIVERSRAKLDIIKQVSYISLIASTGEEISGGTCDDWKNENIKYVKWIMGEDGFVDMEIDTELLSGATLKITYSITVIDKSEKGNEISEIEVIDYVTNNLNYEIDYKDNNGKTNNENNWKTITTDDILKGKYVNEKSMLNDINDNNKIDLSTYQTILKAQFKPGETKTLTLEKNLSPESESNFNYENRVEIVSSKNTTGRGDYTSIYGNLDPTTYTSRQGNLYWDFIQGVTSSADNDVKNITESHGFNAIRIAEDDSACAEEVIVSPPQGKKGIIIPGEYYIIGLTLMLSLVIGAILIKEHKELV